ncbi:hypothetical protein KSP40_PGU004515 [Platanthera guangdongensis]|uniref:Uncharacterized protein n=1 Tax=Platanthera guangdongensis TaxID=2320717 RepID=A0ABR2MML2_9ASPA
MLVLDLERKRLLQELKVMAQSNLHGSSHEASEQQSPLVHLSTDQNDYGPGLYAVPTYPQFMGMMSGYPPSTLIPLTFKIPTRENSTGTAGVELAQEARQQQGPQRPVVVRRFHFAFQLDLALIIKLAAVVFLFSQDGSRHSFILLILFASFIYLYQTGVLTPLMRWIRRGGAPPQPHPAIHPEPPRPALAEGNNPQADNQNQAAQNVQAPAAAVHENPPEAGRRNENQLLAILKEIQMFVTGFITSLLPGFHHHND